MAYVIKSGPGDELSRQQARAVWTSVRAVDRQDESLSGLRYPKPDIERHTVKAFASRACKYFSSPPAAFRFASDGRHRARRGRAVPARVTFVARRGLDNVLSDRASVSRFRQRATGQLELPRALRLIDFLDRLACLLDPVPSARPAIAGAQALGAEMFPPPVRQSVLRLLPRIRARRRESERRRSVPPGLHGRADDQ